EADALLHLLDRRRERQGLVLRALQEMECEPLRGARADAGEPRQLGDQVVDGGGGHSGSLATAGGRAMIGAVDPQRLASLPLFAGLPAGDRARVAQWADEVDVQQGKVLARQGEFAYEFFVILEGRAEVTKDGERLAELGAGDFFGEIGLLESERRTATV